MKSDIKNPQFAGQGKLKIEWAGRRMPVLELISERFEKEKPFKGLRIGACLHVTAETANLMITLKKGGASVVLCASNPLSTQDDVAASLVHDFDIPTFAIKGEDTKTFYRHLQEVVKVKPNITMDDGADLVNALHTLRVVARPWPAGNNVPLSQAGQGIQTRAAQGAVTTFVIQNSKKESWDFFGSSEETTTGVIRLRAMVKDHALKVPVIAVNDSDTKHLFDNRYGTGQSTIDGILRATNMLLAGKTFVVCGYGWCGRGLASRADGMGAQVVVVEVDPVRALEAVMEGYDVMPMKKASLVGDIFVTVTGDKRVITLDHMLRMKDGAVIANSGHFDVEIEVRELEKAAVGKREVRNQVMEFKIPNSKSQAPNKFKIQKSKFKNLYILGEGRLINLAAAEGHPSEVMDMSFADQALAAEWFVKNKGRLKAKVYTLPKRLDTKVAALKLKSMGIKIGKLTRDQRDYLSSWKQGT